MPARSWDRHHPEDDNGGRGSRSDGSTGGSGSGSHVASHDDRAYGSGYGCGSHNPAAPYYSDRHLRDSMAAAARRRRLGWWLLGLLGVPAVVAGLVLLGMVWEAL